jgi:lysosomal-associated transmembrane protein
MIYGAVRGKSLYLMPFFCLQAFDFFVTSLSVIGYLSYVPDIRQVLVKIPNIPLRDELLAMDPQCLSLLILAGILLTLIAKIYFISIIWSCYKFLTIRAEALERDSCVSGIIDGQNLLDMPSSLSAGSDLPDYATAMTDPRFAKKPIYPVPPPPYAAVVNMPPENEPVENRAPAGAEASAQENPKP